MILPGATIGMLGGGQLGRMFTMAARSMGYRVVVLDPDPSSPAGSLANQHICASYTDAEALAQMASLCEVVTTEFENIPADTLRQLAAKTVVYPSAEAVEKTQNRIREKRFICDTGLKTAEFAVIESPSDIDSLASSGFRFPAILKIAEFGYDGKGQLVVHSVDETRDAFAMLEQAPCVLEQRVDLALEVSVVLARAVDGTVSCFPVAENEHRNGILHRSVVPAAAAEALQMVAQEQTIRLAQALDYRGVMAVEFFIDQAGELLVNEIAPRTHNSGHYSLDACVTSQFEQQLRAICGLPLGATTLLSPVVMVNLLGDLWQHRDPDWAGLLADPAVKLHLYGKAEPRPGRKMGHFCWLGEDAARLRDQAEQAFQALT